MPPRTVVVIDDEQPARKLLKEYLSNYEDYTVVGEAANGPDGLRLIVEADPDVVFLDVQMPGMTGLEVVSKLDSLPLIVFSTAYDSYALEAFELHAVDYLLKPYTSARFAQTISRLEARTGEGRAATARLVQQLRDERTPYPERIMVPRGKKYIALPVADIVCIKADGDYSTIVTADSDFLCHYGLGDVEQRLNPTDFLRIHRSTIIGRSAIREIRKEGHGYDILLTNGELVRASRGYAEVVKEILF